MIELAFMLAMFGQDAQPPFLAPFAYVQAKGWTALTSSTDAGVAYLVQPARQRGRIWVRSEYLDPTRYGGRSYSGMMELDCVEWRFRVLQSSLFSAPNLEGTPSTGPSSGWTFAAPGTVGESILDYGCGD